MAQLGGTFLFFGDFPIWGNFHIGDPQRVNVPSPQNAFTSFKAQHKIESWKSSCACANATPRSSKYTLPCPVDGMSLKYSYKVKVFCNIDAIAMVFAYPPSPGCFPEAVLWGRKVPLQFLLRIAPLRGPKTFLIQKLSLLVLVKVTQSIQDFSQTTFLIRRSWDRCWISLPSKLRVLLPFYIPWEAIDGPSFHKSHGKSILA